MLLIIHPTTFPLLASEWSNVRYEMKILLINIHPAAFLLLGSKYADVDLK